jgi:DUF1707 SHOCT-like domain
MRASRADRDQVVDVLKSAFVQERLAKDELDDRIGQALAARTWEDLDALTADIPAGPHPTRPPVPAAPGLARPGPARPVAAGPDLVQAPVTAQASGRPRSLTQNRPVSRSTKTWVAVIAGVILTSGAWGDVLGGPGAGVIMACLAAGPVFVVLWVIASYAVVWKRPGPGIGTAGTAAGGPSPEQRAPAKGEEPE